MTDRDPDLSDLDKLLRDNGVPAAGRSAFLASCRDAKRDSRKGLDRECPGCGRMVSCYQVLCHCGRMVE